MQYKYSGDSDSSITLLYHTEMLLAEISKSMGDLALAVNRKTAELDRMKAEYDTKLRIVNKYIDKINAMMDSSSQTELGELDALEKTVSCPACHTKVYDLDEESEYVLVPRNKIHLLRETESESATREIKAEPLPVPKPGRSKSRTITCSYCNKTGHSRARCFVRLSKEPGTKPV